MHFSATRSSVVCHRLHFGRSNYHCSSTLLDAITAGVTVLSMASPYFKILVCLVMRMLTPIMSTLCLHSHTRTASLTTCHRRSFESLGIKSKLPAPQYHRNQWKCRLRKALWCNIHASGRRMFSKRRQLSSGPFTESSSLRLLVSHQIRSASSREKNRALGAPLRSDLCSEPSSQSFDDEIRSVVYIIAPEPRKNTNRTFLFSSSRHAHLVASVTRAV
jgi:hypothetical protein